MQLHANNIHVWKSWFRDVYIYAYLHLYILFICLILNDQSTFLMEIPENCYYILPHCNCHIKTKQMGEGVEGEKRREQYN